MNIPAAVVVDVARAGQRLIDDVDLTFLFFVRDYGT